MSEHSLLAVSLHITSGTSYLEITRGHELLNLSDDSPVQLTLRLRLGNVQLEEVIKVVNNGGQSVGDLLHLLDTLLHLLVLVAVLDNSLAALAHRKGLEFPFKRDLCGLNRRNNHVLGVAINANFF